MTVDTITIYRFEWTGSFLSNPGLYQGSPGQWLYEIRRDLPYWNDGTRDESSPAPFADDGLRSAWHDLQRGDAYKAFRFGFSSIGQAQGWFPEAVRARIACYGGCLYAIKVPLEHVRLGSHQAIYRADAEVSREAVEWSAWIPDFA